VGSYINLPTLNIDFLKVGRMRFRVRGDGIDGGRNGDGDAPAIDFSGGGRIEGAYENCFVQAPEEHEYANWLAAYLDGSIRNINVPIKTDWMGPFPTNDQGVPQPFVTGIPHSDGSLFSDGAGYSQATVFATFESEAAQNAGQIVINVFGATRNLRWSDWMSTYHATRGWRAWRYWEVSDPVDVTRTVEGFSYNGQQYTIAITPPLREAVPAGQRIELARPRFVGRFPRNFVLDWDVEGFWLSRPTLQFVEAEIR
jgi:hypothetical protein